MQSDRAAGGVASMSHLRLESSRSSRVLFLLLAVCLLVGLSGCGKSRKGAGAPNAPKLRIEGPPGTGFGYCVSYFDGPGDVEIAATAKVIPESGVYAEDLKGGHKGLLVQVTPNRSARLTVILLDDTREIQRATATGENQTAEVKAGTVSASGPFRGR
jgi:hypothetical protein